MTTAKKNTDKVSLKEGADTDILEIVRPAPGITEMWLNRPDKHNAFNPELIARIHQTITRLAADADTRVLIIAGRGKSFCSGADLKYMKSMVNYSHAENVADAARLAAMLRALHDFPKPIIAAVHGNVFAGATGMICCSDLVVAAENTRFSISEVKLGLVPAVISPFVISRMGPHLARRYFLTAEVFDTEAAYAAHLMHESVAADALMRRARELAAQLLRNAPGAMADTKNLIRYLVPVPKDAAVTEYTCELIARVRAAEEALGGLQAFFDKADAPWIASSQKQPTGKGGN